MKNTALLVALLAGQMLLAQNETTTVSEVQKNHPSAVLMSLEDFKNLQTQTEKRAEDINTTKEVVVTPTEVLTSAVDSAPLVNQKSAGATQEAEIIAPQKKEALSPEPKEAEIYLPASHWFSIALESVQGADRSGTTRQHIKQEIIKALEREKIDGFDTKMFLASPFTAKNIEEAIQTYVLIKETK